MYVSNSTQLLLHVATMIYKSKKSKKWKGSLLLTPIALICTTTTTNYMSYMYVICHVHMYRHEFTCGHTYIYYIHTYIHEGTYMNIRVHYNYKITNFNYNDTLYK